MCHSQTKILSTPIIWSWARYYVNHIYWEPIKDEVFILNYLDLTRQTPLKSINQFPTIQGIRGSGLIVWQMEENLSENPVWLWPNEDPDELDSVGLNPLEFTMIWSWSYFNEKLAAPLPAFIPVICFAFPRGTHNVTNLVFSLIYTPYCFLLYKLQISVLRK